MLQQQTSLPVSERSSSVVHVRQGCILRSTVVPGKHQSTARAAAPPSSKLQNPASALLPCTARARVLAQASSHDVAPSSSFQDSNFHRVSLVRRDPYGPLKVLPTSEGCPCSGVLVFQRDGDSISDKTDVMEVFVAGDTAGNIYTTLYNQQADRPMAHDLMYNILSRASALMSQELTLLKVAIVGLKDNIFLGRLYFGDARTRKVLWDCDCRPSDGVYLHLKSACPFYISREVWDRAAVPLRLSKVHLMAVAEVEARVAAMEVSHNSTFPVSQSQASPAAPPAAQQSSSSTHSHAERTSVSPSQASASSGAMQVPHAQGSNAGGIGGGSDGGSGSVRRDSSTSQQDSASDGSEAVPIFPPVPVGPPRPEEIMALRPEDPVPITLLKRKLQVAVSEEDYQAAVKLRDHPYLYLYRQAHTCRYFGHEKDAQRYERELVHLMTADRFDLD